MSTTMYLQNVAGGVQACDGLRLARLLSLRHSPALRIKAAELTSVQMRRCSEIVPAPLDTTAFSHLQAMASRADARVAFGHQRNAVRSFKEFMTSLEEANWILPALEQLTLDLRLLAVRAAAAVPPPTAAALGAGAGPGAAGAAAGAASADLRGEAVLEQAMSDVRECLVVACGDRAGLSESKKWGMMFLINHLFSLAFKLNNFAIVESFRRAMARETEMMEHFHMSHRVTYSFHLGRLHLLNSQFEQAGTELGFAFTHCHRSSTTNKRLILIQLIPVNMLRGILPSPALLEKYDLPQFVELTAAIRCGNVHMFKEALAAHQPFLVQWGVFLVVERAVGLVYRRLLKRVQLISGLTQLPLARLITALRAIQEVEQDLDEVECITAGLIGRSMVRGYISHDKRVLVLSKKEAFPALTSMVLA